MTVKKIIRELNKQYDGIIEYQNARQKKINSIRLQCVAEEKRLHKKLAKQPNKDSRRKLKKKLLIVNKAYSMLDS